MKEPALKKSETCQIIIATYAMASEALDIKTLTTLVLATPKTDIVQAVGRILRVKHERPLVIDIVDSHEVFLSQWQKRRKYYLSNNYTVMHTKSPLYVLDQWEQASVAGKSASASVAGKSASVAGTSTAGTSTAGTSASVAGKSTSAAGKADKQKVKSDAKTLTSSTLLSKGAAAAAKYINTFGKIKPGYEDDM
jgi:superfamily II DNA or RNA helicase